MRSIADQHVSRLGGPHSILSLQRRDHVELDQLLTEVLRRDERTYESTFNRMNRLVFSHAFAEESVLWPVLRRVLPDGEELTHRVEQEHQEVNELVTHLEGVAPSHPAAGPTLDRLAEVLREDVRDEEDELLPRLQERVEPAELVRLGRRWQVVRRVAPTRPHPVVSRRPPGNVVSALPLSVLDRTRDHLDQLARLAPSPVAPVLRRSSHAVAGVAGRVEHLPVVRRGERADTAR
jgi:Hemerythrin HHE cation binding domain